MAALTTVTRSSFTFRTDVPPPNRSSHRSGILHATRSDRGREEHAFAWLDDRTHAAGVDAVVSQLSGSGFVRSRMVFLPYGRREDWVHRYPHACPYMHCDAEGRVTGVPYFRQCINDNGVNWDGAAAERAGSRPAKRRRRCGGSGDASARWLLPSAVLSDHERSRLHAEIYAYLSWLHSELADAEAASRHRVQRAGISLPGIRSILTKMESTFRDVGELRKREDGGGNDGEVNEPGGRGGNETNDDGGGGAVNDDSEKENDAPKVPMLEERLKLDLTAAVEETRGQDLPPQKGRTTFEDMFQRLMAYREQRGDANVPYAYKEDASLGRWVCDLRKARKALQDTRGLEFDDQDPPGVLWTLPVQNGPLGLQVQFSEGTEGASVVGVDPDSALKDHIKAGDRLLTVDGSAITKVEDMRAGKDGAVRVFGVASITTPHATFLSRERVERLDSIGFKWAGMRQEPLPWDAWLQILKRYKEEKGTWPVRREKWNGHTIGEWCNAQRRHYKQKNHKFMADRAPKLDEIGFPWMLKKSVVPTSWEDHFFQLVEFGKVNGNFDVPKPDVDERDEGDSKSKASLRFYRWVESIHRDYRRHKEAKPTRDGLNEDRINQLLAIGFKFHDENSRTARNVPDIPFETRLDQVKRFRDDFGHCNIDHRCHDMDNLGGWAEEISKRHKDWLDRKEDVSSIETEQFNQLSNLGFEFNISRPGVRERRSWEDNFNLFLEFRKFHGHGHIPNKYKADKRLGAWSRITRSECKLFSEGKKCRLTRERYDRLLEAGFECEVKHGQYAISKRTS